MEQIAKPPSTAMKFAFFGAFVVVWLVLCFVLVKTSDFFREGGWGMWPILAAGLVFIVITIDRARYLFGLVKADSRALASQTRKHLMQGDVRGALTQCERSRNPMARIVEAGLAQLHRPDDEVQEAMDEAALYELPRIEIRTGYLAMIGNIATLLGLLGTIVGLITSFAGVSLEDERNPETQKRAEAYVYLVDDCQGKHGAELVACIKLNKATILARGISEAMHCTAFGLAVGILALLAFSVLNGRTQHLLDDITDGSVKLVSLAVAHRSAMQLDTLEGNAGDSLRPPI
jgi:biopolymer transport protein ExbB